MHLRSFSPRAWVLVGALVFASGCTRAEIAKSGAPLAPVSRVLPAPTAPLAPSAPLAQPTPAATSGVLLSTEPFVNPFGTKKPKIVSGFGSREVQLPALLPGTTTQAVKEMHEGVDYRAFPGSAVKAARSGKVIFAGFSKMYVSRADKTDQHRLVIIRHSDGTSTRYVHLNTLHVKPGQDVQAGQVLGVLAESDEWKEPVLHFEVRDIRGQAMDPVKWVVDPATPETSKPK
jgi:murein DD-endopeptidase MepM/ murein hydrolase activator NlpD